MKTTGAAGAVDITHLSYEALVAERDRLQVLQQVGELAGADVKPLVDRLAILETALQRLEARRARAKGANSSMLLEIANQYVRSLPKTGRAVVLADES